MKVIVQLLYMKNVKLKKNHLMAKNTYAIAAIVLLQKAKLHPKHKPMA